MLKKDEDSINLEETSNFKQIAMKFNSPFFTFNFDVECKRRYRH